MRTVVAGLLFLVLGCTAPVSSPRSWEYKVLSVPAGSHPRFGEGALDHATATPPVDELNRLGAEGWELVSSHVEHETAFPNFGPDAYVAGLQPNVRPQRLVLLFKRPGSGR